MGFGVGNCWKMSEETGVKSIRELAQETQRRRAETAVKETVHRLSTMQRTAVIEWLSGKTKTEACQIAGYANPERQQTRVFANESVLAAIDDFFRQQEMSAREVVARLSQQAKAAYSDYLLSDGTVDLQGLLSAGLGHLIKGYRHTNNGLVVDFYDAQAALVQVGRYHGLFTDNTDVTTGGEPVQGITYITENRGNDSDGRKS